MLRYGFSGRLCFAVALVVGLPALAAAALHPPTLSLVTSDRSSITVGVTAGSTGAPAGFELQWMTQADYAQRGGWPTNENDPAIRVCSFVGTPTLNPTPGVSAFTLSAGVTVQIHLGKLFDETGVITYYTDELQAGTAYVLRARALASAPWPTSAYSSTLSGSTNPPGPGCVLTQGFWKNHPESWPVNSLRLGSVVYTQAQLLDILNTPAAGNGLTFLAHQLIATKLNIASGASGASIAATVAAADALIDGLVVPPIGSGFLDPSAASALTDMLDDFNNGMLGVPHCDTVPTADKTWSQVKKVYR